jgi:predicted lipid-binding transport protein (Tim44 family)
MASSRVQGAAAALGGAMAGALYQHSLPGLIAVVSATQLTGTALVLLVITLARREPEWGASDTSANGCGEPVQQQERRSVTLPLERDAEPADFHSVHTVNHPTSTLATKGQMRRWAGE